MADSPKDLQFREMKDTITELNKLIKTLRETIEMMKAQQEQVSQERDNLKEQVDYLTRKLFGSSSEKGVAQIPGQMDLFNEAEAAQDPALASQEEAFVTKAPADKTARKSRKNNEDRFKGLPVEKCYLDVPEEERICRICGTLLEKIGEEFVRREIQFTRPKVKILEYYSVNYGCPSCKKNADLPCIVKGKDGRAHMIHGMASASTVAYVIYQKYFNGMPLYRQERDWKQCGAQISRATLANWVIQNADAFFRPMYDFFHKELLKRQFVMANETPVQVLHEPGRRAQTQAYM